MSVEISGDKGPERGVEGDVYETLGQLLDEGLPRRHRIGDRWRWDGGPE